MKTTTVTYTCDICGGPIDTPHPYNLEREITINDKDSYTAVRVHHVHNHVGAEHICDDCVKHILRLALDILGG